MLFHRQTAGEVLTYFVYVPRLVLVFLDLCALFRVWSTFDKRYGAAFRDFRRLLCVCLSLVVVRLWRGAHVLLYAPRLVLAFLGFCRLLFGKSPLCKQKSNVQDVQPSTTSVVLFLCQAVGKVLTYLCTFRSLSSPSSTCAPCSAFGQRLARDNNSATHARLSRFSAFALRLLVSCCCQAVARCSRTSCTLRALSSSSLTCAPCFVFGQRLTRDTAPPFAMFNACSAPDYLFVSNTLRALSSSFLAFAVCSLASHLFASKKAVFKTCNKSTAICRAF